MSTKPARTIAVVDDDAEVRASIARLMRSLGWDVRQFASGILFLQSQSANDTDCLITDVRMANLTGVELHDQLLDQGYVLPTIFMTAFPTPDLEAKRNAPGVVAIFEKPIDPTELADCVEQALRAA